MTDPLFSVRIVTDPLFSVRILTDLFYSSHRTGSVTILVVTSLFSILSGLHYSTKVQFSVPCTRNGFERRLKGGRGNSIGKAALAQLEDILERKDILESC